MKKGIYIVVLCLSAGMLLNYGCNSDRYKIDARAIIDSSGAGMHLTIKDIRGVYQGKDIKLGKDLDSLFGVVISDAKSGNVPDGYLIIQQGQAGIALSLKDQSGSASFAPGDSVAVNIRGGSLVKQNGNLVLTGLSTSDIKKVGENKTVKPTPVLLVALQDDFDKYNETLVKVAGADIVPKPQNGDTYSGSKGLSDGSTAPGAIKLYTSPGSAIAQKEALANATFTGIALYGTATGSDSLVKEIWPRNESDIANTSQPLYSDIIITGFMPNPRGSDQKAPGDVTNYGGGAANGGVTINHIGGYEYIQLMALKDIDFSKTPYSVVIARDGVLKATDKGWAAGGSVTYKFDLTSGVAARGTFFYVGSSSKRLAGYWPDGPSEDISGANWIRSITVYVGNTTTTTGDGFGNSTTALLGNGDGVSTELGVGIAVFKGTNINSTSVPVDAVFYNPPPNGFPIQGAQYSYLIPAKSDLYSATGPSGNSQPYYGEGSNIFTVSHDAACCDASHWVKMGGIFSPNAIISPRTHPTVVALGRTSQLSDIESGPGVTDFRE